MTKTILIICLKVIFYYFTKTGFSSILFFKSVRLVSYLYLSKLSLKMTEIIGNDFPQSLFGTENSDNIFGSGGNDTIDGLGGNDLLFGNIGLDQINGNQGDDTISGGKDDDLILGGIGNDFLRGDLDRDTIRGEDGNDFLFGGRGDDELFGDSGSDTLSGDRGIDTLTGGSGGDVFVLVQNGEGPDIITDYNDVDDFMQLPGGITFDNLLIQANGNQTTISIVSTGERLAILNNVSPSEISSSDFISGTSSPTTPLTPPTTIDPGNSPGDALNIGVLNGTVTSNEFVGNTDTKDYYRFDVASPINFSLYLDGLGADADVTVYQDSNNNGVIDSNESGIASGSRSGTSSESITRNLGIGNYFVLVEPASQGSNTNYTLRLVNETSETANIGVLGGTRTFNEFVGRNDPVDYYRFSLNSPRTFTLSLDGLSADADVTVYQDSNDNGVIDSNESGIASGSRSGTSSESITRNLGIGNYFVLIESGSESSNTNYNLTLSA
ncbi:calcium-binding protein [Planktothrix agardhii]|uniref:calcium-binding protein n=1 Tax=Planktothrix agardhii TaxID=1160 RepID=UPI001D0A37BA|nr:calcium-binding protein [Planktothrix agardhii]MCB8785599.1 pre-peptidase C-terminal domain-containing protein [Planktothrix agardhii 1025]MCF3612681.1 pre-peptidase C-terminal domain-containing protein [Planktothrix agardhii 1027]MCF3646558.1 pre-peptidase C-terminal domain-containing protein [Planktothrix agardhii 1026]CAD5944791.1 Bifunctional hemolysin/adenylate cyclase [Planktothrix agardhii]